MEAWGLALADVIRNPLHAYRRRLDGEEVLGLQHKEKPGASTTISRKISVCCQFFVEALDRGLVKVNPADIPSIF